MAERPRDGALLNPEHRRQHAAGTGKAADQRRQGQHHADRRTDRESGAGNVRVHQIPPGELVATAAAAAMKPARCSENDSSIPIRRLTSPTKPKATNRLSASVPCVNSVKGDHQGGEDDRGANQRAIAPMKIDIAGSESAARLAESSGTPRSPRGISS